MKDYIADRTLAVAEYIVKTGCTVRQAAKVFKVSKSTVHKDISERLKIINPALANMARIILDTNKAERHLRGGMATRIKYEKKRKSTFKTKPGL